MLTEVPLDKLAKWFVIPILCSNSRHNQIKLNRVGFSAPSRHSNLRKINALRQCGACVARGSILHSTLALRDGCSQAIVSILSVEMIYPISKSVERPPEN